MNFSWAVHFGQDLAEAVALGFHSTVPLLFAGELFGGQKLNQKQERV